MKVRTKQDSRNMNSVVAYAPSVGKWKPLLCLFDSDCDKLPAPNVEVEVMISGALFHKDDHGVSTCVPKLLFIRTVTEDDILVHHGGFQKNASNSCLAMTRHNLIAYTLTPGKVGVQFAELQGTKVPGTAYIRRQCLGHNMTPIQGVPNIQDMAFHEPYANAVIKEISRSVMTHSREPA